MAKSYLGDDDDSDLFSADDYDSNDGSVETPKRETKAHGRHGARQRLDSRKEDLWLKQQLSDWGDEFDEGDHPA
jgi:hypothetical protein